MIRILLVDDSAVARRWLSQSLSIEEDLEIIAQGKNGVEAISLVQEHKPDLVIMDMAMPDMDGVEATKKIMEVQPTPVIMLTANVNRPEGMEPDDGIHEGALQVIEKPGSQKDLDSWRENLLRTIRAAGNSDVIKEFHV